MLRLNVELSDEVRAVFDRMLATDEQIRAAEEAARFSPLLSDPIASGMTQEEHAAYMEAAEKATRAAEGEMLARAMREVTRERSAEIREARARLRSQVTEEVAARPVYRAIDILSKGDQGGAVIRLGREIVERQWGKEAVAALAKLAVPPVMRKGRLHPDDAAPLLGFGSGDELIQALTEAPKRSEIIAAETERRRARVDDHPAGPASCKRYPPSQPLLVVRDTPCQIRQPIR